MIYTLTWIKDLLCFIFFLVYINLLCYCNIVNSQSYNHHLYNISDENHYIINNNNNVNIDHRNDANVNDNGTHDLYTEATTKLSIYNHNNNDDNNDNNSFYDKALFSRNLQQEQQQQQLSSKRYKNNQFFDIKGRINYSILYRCQFNNSFAIKTLKNEKDNYYISYTLNDTININNNKEFTIYSFQRDFNVIIDPLGLLQWSRPGKR